MEKTDTIMNRGGRVRTLLAVLAVLAVLCALLPYLAAQRYALFNGDDFTNVTRHAAASGNALIIKAVNAAKIEWRRIAGTYSGVFLMALLNPLQIYSYGLLRAELIGLTLGTVAAAFWLASLFCGYLGIERRNSAFLCALVITPLLLYREYSEIYLWFTAAVGYLMSLLFLILALVFLLKGRKGKELWYALAALSVFMMSGGVLECVGFGMFLLLLLCIVERIREGRVRKGFCAVFVIGLAGALLNALAPGNYVRYNVEDAASAVSASMLGSLLNSGRAVLQELGWMFGSTGFIAFLVLAFLLGLSLRKQLDKRCLAVALAGFALAPVVTIFPVVLGYNWQGAEFPNRCLFLLDVSLYLSLVMIAVLLGCRLSAVRLPKGGRVICAAAAVAIAVSPLLYVPAPRSYPPAEIMKNLQDGTIEQFSVEWRLVYDYLRECGPEDVIIRRPMPERRAGCAMVKMDAIPDSWADLGIAEYFGLKSVCLNPPVPDEIIEAIQ